MAKEIADKSLLVKGDIVDSSLIKKYSNEAEAELLEENGECSYGCNVIKITSCWSLYLFKVSGNHRLYSLGRCANKHGKLIELTVDGYYCIVPTESTSVGDMVIYLGDNLVDSCNQFNILKSAYYSK